jgi:hypothetical protein
MARNPMPLWPFRPKLPVDADTQEWVDRRMQWLVDQFGIDRLRSARPVEPTDEFFPDPYDRSEAAVQRMLDRICPWMDIDPARIELQFYPERRNPYVRNENDSIPGSAGHYRVEHKEIIAVERSTLTDPTVVVATLAHELAHVRLLGEQRLSRDAEDHERLTDLATVFFGLGIFTANSVFKYSQWSRDGWQGWKVSAHGYLDECTLAYALALWTTRRGQPRPSWVRHLTVTPRAYTKHALRYLQKYPPAFA